jgi:hypothetical protein
VTLRYAYEYHVTRVLKSSVVSLGSQNAFHLTTARGCYFLLPCLPMVWAVQICVLLFVAIDLINWLDSICLLMNESSPLRLVWLQAGCGGLTRVGLVFMWIFLSHVFSLGFEFCKYSEILTYLSNAVIFPVKSTEFEVWVHTYYFKTFPTSQKTLSATDLCG